jgi:hypothetical protein
LFVGGHVAGLAALLAEIDEKAAARWRGQRRKTLDSSLPARVQKKPADRLEERFSAAGYGRINSHCIAARPGRDPLFDQTSQSFECVAARKPPQVEDSFRFGQLAKKVAGLLRVQEWHGMTM